MVVSQLVETVEYKENKNIEKNDSDLEVCLYKIKLYDIHVLISLGKINKRYKKYNVGYCPVYLVIDENKIYQDDNIVGKRTRFLSKHHFIEINKREQNNEG